MSYASAHTLWLIPLDNTCTLKCAKLAAKMDRILGQSVLSAAMADVTSVFAPGAVTTLCANNAKDLAVIVQIR
jgi:hypothetical protein